MGIPRDENNLFISPFPLTVDGMAMREYVLRALCFFSYRQLARNEDFKRKTNLKSKSAVGDYVKTRNITFQEIYDYSIRHDYIDDIPFEDYLELKTNFKLSLRPRITKAQIEAEMKELEEKEQARMKKFKQALVDICKELSFNIIELKGKSIQDIEKLILTKVTRKDYDNLITIYMA